MLHPFLVSIINASRQGLYLATGSFKLLFAHPVLLIYYALLLSVHAALFVIAYNIIGYHSAFMNHVNEFQIPHNNLLEDVVPQTGWLLFASLWASIFIAILLRNLAGAALIKHAHALLNGQQISISAVLEAIKAKLKPLLSWTALITLITVGAQITALAPAGSALIVAIIISLAFIAWSTASFFVLPIITLEAKSVPDAIRTSIHTLLATLWQVCGGLLWLAVLYALGFGLVNLLYLLPFEKSAHLAYAALLVLNGLFSQAFLIFKTKLYHRFTALQKEVIEEESSVDFSQF